MKAVLACFIVVLFAASGSAVAGSACWKIFERQASHSLAEAITYHLAVPARRQALFSFLNTHGNADFRVDLLELLSQVSDGARYPVRSIQRRYSSHDEQQVVNKRIYSTASFQKVAGRLAGLIEESFEAESIRRYFLENYQESAIVGHKVLIDASYTMARPALIEELNLVLRFLLAEALPDENLTGSGELERPLEFLFLRRPEDGGVKVFRFTHAEQVQQVLRKLDNINPDSSDVFAVFEVKVGSSIDLNPILNDVMLQVVNELRPFRSDSRYKVSLLTLDSSSLRTESMGSLLRGESVRSGQIQIDYIPFEAWVNFDILHLMRMVSNPAG